MTPTLTGMAVGAVLALTWVFAGFWAALFVAFAIALGAGIGRLREGKLDVRALGDVLTGRRAP